jgi:hypothetical protein
MFYCRRRRKLFVKAMLCNGQHFHIVGGGMQLNNTRRTHFFLRFYYYIMRTRYNGTLCAYCLSCLNGAKLSRFVLLKALRVTNAYTG